MDDEPGEVVRFPVAAHLKTRNELDAEFEKLPLRSVPRNYEVCRHRSSSIDFAARVVRCRDCGVDLDPIKVLHDLAENHEYYVRLTRMLRRDVDDLQKRKAELERAERNAKSRIRTARRSRSDEEALAAAARAGLEANGWALEDWDKLDPERRGSLIRSARPICEAYLAALS